MSWHRVHRWLFEDEINCDRDDVILPYLDILQKTKHRLQVFFFNPGAPLLLDGQFNYFTVKYNT